LLKSEIHPERVAIVEFDSSHDECLLTQINALRSRNYWVLLVTNDDVRSRNPHLESLVDAWSEIDPKGEKIRGAAIGDALIIRRLMRFLKHQQVDKVIFNTAQGGHVRNACLFSLFRKMEFIGIIHTIRKFQGSFTQRIINLKMKKYFVLADFLKNEVTSTQIVVERSRSHHRQLASFYPLDFPKGKITEEPDEKIHIAIIGSVEKRRKDLAGFVSLIQCTDPSVHFHFLGNADPKNSDVINLKEDLKRIDCLNRVDFFEKRIENANIDKILRKSVAILPLVHPDTPSSEEYFRNQIPGAMSVALGYKIPLLMHISFGWIEELKPASVYYSFDDFSSAIIKLKSDKNAIRQEMKRLEQFSSEYQYRKYLDFIFG